MIRRFAAAYAVALVCALPVGAQRFASLRGTVLADSGDAPIVGAQVSIPALALTVLTDSLGGFHLRGIPVGRQLIQVRRIGFQALSTVLTFAANDTLEREFGLVVVVRTLPEVEVRGKATPIATGKMSEFDRRRAARLGHFITQPMLEQVEARLTSDVLRTVPGLKLMRNPRKPTEWYVANNRGIQSFLRNQGALCMAAVMVDGVTVYSGEEPEPFNINSLSPREMAGVEYYAGGATMPVEYNATRNTCGLVVIWTRVR